jgi:hypothetical protein
MRSDAYHKGHRHDILTTHYILDGEIVVRLPEESDKKKTYGVGSRWVVP